MRRPSRLTTWSVPQWQIDKLNVSGVASDRNVGTTRGAPLRTFAELLSRYETQRPYLFGQPAININFMSGDVDTSDPLIFEPDIDAGVSFSISADLQGGISGTLSNLTANSIAGNQALQANLPAGTVLGSLVVNSTRGNSTARAYANISGNLWTLTQPVTAIVSGSLPVGDPTQDNTWANTDSVTVYAPASNGSSTSSQCNLHVVRLIPRLNGVNATFNNQALVQNINFADINPAPGFSFNWSQLGGVGVLYSGCSFNRMQILDTDFSTGSNTRFVCCDMAPGGAITGGTPTILTLVEACSWRNHTGYYPLGLGLDCGTVIIGNESIRDIVVCQRLGVVYVDGGGTGRTLNLAASFGPLIPMATNSGYNGGQPAVYGSGGLDARGIVFYTGTAVASFPCAAGLKIRGKSTAYAPSTSAGTTTWKQLALTPTNLDLAAPSGFGGYGVWPGMGGFANGAAQP